MAARNSNLASRFPGLTADALKEIVETDLEDTELNNYLNMAYHATRKLAGKLGECGGKGGEELIVKVLAAHFLTMTEQQPKRVRSGDWSATYRGEDGMGLEASSYGQQAIALDCSGELAEQATGLRVAKLRAVTYYDMQEEDNTAVI